MSYNNNQQTAGGNAADAVGDKIKGGWNAFHGSGEAIRGNINEFVDNVGEQIAGRGNHPTTTGPGAHTGAATTTSTAAPVTRTEGGERPSHVAARGADEFREGVERMKH